MSRRTGYGRVDGAGKVERFGLDTQGRPPAMIREARLIYGGLLPRARAVQRPPPNPWLTVSASALVTGPR